MTWTELCFKKKKNLFWPLAIPVATSAICYSRSCPCDRNWGQSVESLGQGWEIGKVTFDSRDKNTIRILSYKHWCISDGIKHLILLYPFCSSTMSEYSISSNAWVIFRLYFLLSLRLKNYPLKCWKMLRSHSVNICIECCADLLLRRKEILALLRTSENHD